MGLTLLLGDLLALAATAAVVSAWLALRAVARASEAALNIGDSVADRVLRSPAKAQEEAAPQEG